MMAVQSLTDLAISLVEQEVRCMLRCRKQGIDTPVVYMVDKERARIYMEFVLGLTVKDHLFRYDLSSAAGA